MANFTSTQGRYLAFIHAYTQLHGYPPAETEIAAALCVSPPSVNPVQVERIEQAIPTVPYPRVIKRVGKSPPQYCEE